MIIKYIGVAFLLLGMFWLLGVLLGTETALKTCLENSNYDYDTCYSIIYR